MLSYDYRFDPFPPPPGFELVWKACFTPPVAFRWYCNGFLGYRARSFPVQLIPSTNCYSSAVRHFNMLRRTHVIETLGVNARRLTLHLASLDCSQQPSGIMVEFLVWHVAVIPPRGPTARKSCVCVLTAYQYSNTSGRKKRKEDRTPQNNCAKGCVPWLDAFCVIERMCS